jgi:ABC-type glycerol-3-phosphate transport system substrate-binding protein
MAAQARRRSLIAALLVSGLALAGCGANKDEGGLSGGGKVIGRTVTVYSLISDPGGSNRDFVDAETLALADAGGRAGVLSVNFTSLDLGGSDEKLQAQAARRAISDPQIIAAIVDATKVTVPLFNAAGILQVATSGDPSLADDPQALPSGKRTVGPAPDEAPPADFAARFAKAFGHAPAPSAATGYRAMAGVLKAIGAAGAAGNDRAHVIRAYFS